MLADNIKAKGLVSFILTDAEGNVKKQEDHNLVVNSGLAFIASRIHGTPGEMNHIAVGTNTIAAANTDTTLGAETARVAIDSATAATTNVTNDTVQYVATFGPGVGTAGLTEAGIFNDSQAGTMLARTVFPVINKGAGDTLTITWKVTVA